MNKFYGLAALACLLCSTAYADDIETLDYNVGVNYGPPEQPGFYTQYPGSLTYDLDTGALISYAVVDTFYGELFPSCTGSISAGVGYAACDTPQFVGTSSADPLTIEWSTTPDAAGNFPILAIDQSLLFENFGVGIGCGVSNSSETCTNMFLVPQSAPEIAPGMAGSALTLLAGALAMVRGRKRSA